MPVPWRSVASTTCVPSGASVSGSSNALDGLGRDERQVDRQDEDRLRAAGDDVGPCLGEARVEAAGSLAKGPGADLGCAGQDLGVGADDQDVVEPIDGQGGGDGPCQEALDEVMPLLRIERPAEPRLGALEGADRDDRRDPHRGVPGAPAATPANSRTSRASRARPGWSPMTVSTTSVR